MNRLAELILKDGPLYVKGDGLSFCSYFGALSCEEIALFTDIRRLTARIETTGESELFLWHLFGSARLLASKKGTGRVEIEFPLPEKGMLYLTVRTSGKVTGGGYYVAEPQKNKVSVAVVICTYHREEYVKRNVEKLVGCDKGIAGVYVVDNGRTLEEGDLPGANLIPSRNFGGSGGFCRGMAEVAREKKFTHLLLMDDDITFETESIKRIVSFLTYLKDPDATGIGSSMLIEEQPTVQYELGGKWDGDRLRGLKRGIDLSTTKGLVANAGHIDADYAAWWCCCLPVSAIEKVGYPLPLFIKNDDVEYGIRSGLKWAFPSGVGVWHTSFERKYSPALEYYIKRNELIVDCLTREKKAALKKLLRSVALQLVQQRYFVIPYILKGYEDFLKGPIYLAEVDGEMLNAAILSTQPKPLSKAELEEMGYDLRKIGHAKRRSKLWQVVTLNGQLLPTFLYEKEGRTRIVNSTDCPPRDFFGAKKTVQYNPYTQTGFITEQDRSKIISTSWQLMKMAVKLFFSYRRKCKEYREWAPYLMTLEYWEEKWKK